MASTLPNNHALERAVEAHMRILRVRYLEKLPETTHSIERLLRSSERRALTASECAELQMTSHKLAGNGATYGFPAISRIARRVSGQLRAKPGVFDASLGKMTLSLISACRMALGSEATYAAPIDGLITIQKAPDGPPGVDLPAGPASRTSLPRVLVVDHDKITRLQFGDLLGANAIIDTAGDAEEALEKIDGFCPDLILVEDVLPSAITGLPLVDYIQRNADYSAMPVAVIPLGAPLPYDAVHPRACLFRHTLGDWEGTGNLARYGLKCV